MEHVFCAIQLGLLGTGFVVGMVFFVLGTFFDGNLMLRRLEPMVLKFMFGCWALSIPFLILMVLSQLLQ
ncbi:MAG: hypothetical protein D6698_13795 [Gammaproteobacteria bacterium]|nr:MAG: hypothetical protein D6698_13795 [Gammaproteobacteria bacterium]